MEAQPTPSPNDASFLLLKRSKSSLLGGEKRSSWISDESDNSVPAIPVPDTPQQRTESPHQPTREMSSPSSSVPLRQQPSSSFRTDVTSQLHGSGDEADRWNSSPRSHPLATNSSLVPSHSRHHGRSSTASASNSSQGGHMGSPRAHPYQLAAYDSFNYRTTQDISDNSPTPNSTSYTASPNLRPTTTLSNERTSAYGRQHLSPRTPNPPLPTNTLLSDVDGQGAETERKRSQRRRNAPRRASLSSLRILNNYPVPSAPKTPRLGKSSMAHIITFFSTALLLPVILPVIYLPTGHAILKAARQKDANVSIYSVAPILSSIRAGAVGGAILALPILLVLYLLGLFPSSVSNTAREAEPPARPGQRAGEDFFDDSDGGSMDWKNICNPTQLARYGSMALCALLVLSIGGLSGPLGVTALSSSSGDAALDAALGKVVYLTPGAAAASGMVGGCIVIGGSLSMILLSAGTMALFSSIDHTPLAMQQQQNQQL